MYSTLWKLHPRAPEDGFPSHWRRTRAAMGVVGEAPTTKPSPNGHPEGLLSEEEGAEVAALAAAYEEFYAATPDEDGVDEGGAAAADNGGSAAAAADEVSQFASSSDPYPYSPNIRAKNGRLIAAGHSALAAEATGSAVSRGLRRSAEGLEMPSSIGGDSLDAVASLRSAATEVAVSGPFVPPSALRKAQQQHQQHEDGERGSAKAPPVTATVFLSPPQRPLSGSSNNISGNSSSAPVHRGGASVRIPYVAAARDVAAIIAPRPPSAASNSNGGEGQWQATLMVPQRPPPLAPRTNGGGRNSSGSIPSAAQPLAPSRPATAPNQQQQRVGSANSISISSSGGAALRMPYDPSATLFPSAFPPAAPTTFFQRGRHILIDAMAFARSPMGSAGYTAAGAVDEKGEGAEEEETHKKGNVVASSAGVNAAPEAVANALLRVLEAEESAARAEASAAINAAHNKVLIGAFSHMFELMARHSVADAALAPIEAEGGYYCQWALLGLEAAEEAARRALLFAADGGDNESSPHMASCAFVEAFAEPFGRGCIVIAESEARHILARGDAARVVSDGEAIFSPSRATSKELDEGASTRSAVATAMGALARRALIQRIKEAFALAADNNNSNYNNVAPPSASLNALASLEACPAMFDLLDDGDLRDLLAMAEAAAAARTEGGGKSPECAFEGASIAEPNPPKVGSVASGGANLADDGPSDFSHTDNCDVSRRGDDINTPDGAPPRSRLSTPPPPSPSLSLTTGAYTQPLPTGAPLATDALSCDGKEEDATVADDAISENRRVEPSEGVAEEPSRDGSHSRSDPSADHRSAHASGFGGATSSCGGEVSQQRSEGEGEGEENGEETEGYSYEAEEEHEGDDDNDHMPEDPDAEGYHHRNLHDHRRADNNAADGSDEAGAASDPLADLFPAAAADPIVEATRARRQKKKSTASASPPQQTAGRSERGTQMVAGDYGHFGEDDGDKYMYGEEYHDDDYGDAHDDAYGYEEALAAGKGSVDGLEADAPPSITDGVGATCNSAAPTPKSTKETARALPPSRRPMPRRTVATQTPPLVSVALDGAPIPLPVPHPMPTRGGKRSAVGVGVQTSGPTEEHGSSASSDPSHHGPPSAAERREWFEHIARSNAHLRASPSPRSPHSRHNEEEIAEETAQKDYCAPVFAHEQQFAKAPTSSSERTRPVPIWLLPSNSVTHHASSSVGDEGASGGAVSHRTTTAVNASTTINIDSSVVYMGALARQHEARVAALIAAEEAGRAAVVAMEESLGLTVRHRCAEGCLCGNEQRQEQQPHDE